MKFEIVHVDKPKSETSKVYLDYDGRGGVDLMVNGVKIVCLKEDGKLLRYYISLTDALNVPIIKVNDGGRIVTNFGEGDIV